MTKNITLKTNITNEEEVATAMQDIIKFYHKKMVSKRIKEGLTKKKSK